MADIDVERKSGTPVWPWILGLLVLALLAWLLLGRTDRDRVVTPIAEDTIPAAEAVPGQAQRTAAVDQYLTWHEQTDTAEMGVQHEYTATGLRQLADALESIVRQDAVGETAIEPRMQTLRQNANQLQETHWESQDHSNLAREGFISAAEVVEALRDHRFTQQQQLGQSVPRVRQSAEAVSPTVPLLEQRDAVHRFFDSSADALRQMTDNRAGAQTGRL
jgi:hypothetical protein